MYPIWICVRYWKNGFIKIRDIPGWGKQMSIKKANLFELSESERINLIKEAKMSLLRQVLEARLFREFAQIYGCNC